MDVEVVLNNERTGDAVTYKVHAAKELEKERRGAQGQRLPAEGGTSSAAAKLKIDGFTIKM
jgi:hypothetical protein